MTTKKIEIELMEFHYKIIEELIGVFGDNEVEVIEKIISDYFIRPDIFDMLKRIREDKKRIGLLEPYLPELKKKLIQLFNFSKDTPLEFALEYCSCSRKWFLSQVHILAKDLKFKIINNIIIKEE